MRFNSSLERAERREGEQVRVTRRKGRKLSWGFHGGRTFLRGEGCMVWRASKGASCEEVACKGMH
jgi:hypothetical protein